MDALKQDNNVHLTVSNDNARGVMLNTLNSTYLLGGIERDSSGNITKAGLLITTLTISEALVLGYLIQSVPGIFKLKVTVTESEPFAKVLGQWEAILIDLTEPYKFSNNVKVFRRTRVKQEN